MYAALFDRFGRRGGITAIAAKGIQDIDANHWLSQLLQNHIAHLRKLSFDEYPFRNSSAFLSQYITHLTIQHNPLNSIIEWPDFHNLMKLELSRDISFETIEKREIKRIGFDSW